MANAIEFVVKGIDQFSGTFKSVQESMKGVERQAQSFERRTAQLGQTLTAGVTLPLAAAGAAVLNLAGDFEASMNRVGAVSGATGDQLATLEDLAEKLGAATQFSASQAADAMGFLAQAGFEVSEIATALPGTLQLASAAQIGLAESADIASNILTGFGKSAEQLAAVNDDLVTTFTNSNTNIRQLGEAMEEVGPIANSAGQDFEVVLAAIGRLGDAGIQGSKAGTSLRNAMSRLLDPTAQVAETLDKLNIQVVDANGRLLGLDRIVQQLEPHAENTAAIIRIFGQEAGPGMAALASQGADALTRLADEMRDNTGVAARIAEQQMQGFNGAMKGVSSAIEALALSIAASGFLDFATQIAHRLADIIRWASQLPAPIIEAGTVIAATLGVGGPVLLAISVLSKAIRGLIAATGPIGLLITAATLVIQAWMLWGDEIRAIVSNAVVFITEQWNQLRTRTFEIFEAIKQIPALAFEIMRQRLTETFTLLKDQIINTAREIRDNVVGFFQDTYNKVVGNSIVPEMVFEILKEFDTMRDKGIKTTKNFNVNTVKEFEDMSEKSLIVVDKGMEFINNSLSQALSMTLKGTKTFKDAMIDVFKEMVDRILDEIARLVANQVFGKLLDTIFPGAGTFLSSIGVGGFFGDILGGIGDFFGGLFHGGISHVPREGVSILAEGERVLSRDQNEDFTRMLQGGGLGGGISIESASFHFFENVHDAGAMLSMSKEEWREVVARKVIPAFNDLDRSGVRQVSIERARR